MPIAGTGTGPFTITGTETTLSIFNAVVAANAANATKNSDNTQFDFNCQLLVGDGTNVTSWTSTEEQVRIDASSFQIRANATLTIGIASPARAGGSWRWQMTGNDQFSVAGTLRAFASRLYASHRVSANTGATVYFEECVLAFLDSLTNSENNANPNIQYVRCFLAGASGVAMKVGGAFSTTDSKISGATYAFQSMGTPGGAGVYSINDYTGQGNTNDVVANNGGAGQFNIIGAFDSSGAPRSSLIISTSPPTAAGNTVRLQWRYGLNCLFAGVGLAGATVRIRNTNGVNVFTGTTNASGAIPQQVLTRMEYIDSATATNRFPYDVRVRAYDRSSEQITYQADNHTTQQIVHAAVVNLGGITQATAAAFAVTFTASGSTGGTATINSNLTAQQVWAAYRNWISALANFDSNDTWDFDGATLDAGAWNVVVSAGATLTGNLTTTGSITVNGSVSGVIIDSNNAGRIDVVGASPGDTVEMRRASNGTLIASRTGPGSFAVSPANVGASVYFVRLAGTDVIYSSKTTPVTLSAGSNPNAELYAGAAVQIAQLTELASINALVTTNLDAKVSSRLSVGKFLALKD
jgi:hypothetical protein